MCGEVGSGVLEGGSRRGRDCEGRRRTHGVDDRLFGVDFETPGLGVRVQGFK